MRIYRLFGLILLFFGLGISPTTYLRAQAETEWQHVYQKLDLPFDAEAILGLSYREKGEVATLEFISSNENSSDSFKKLKAIISKHTKVRVNGVTYTLEELQKKSWDKKNPLEIKVYFHGQETAHIKLDPNQQGRERIYKIKGGSPHLSTYDLRQLASRGEHYLPEWKKRGTQFNYQVLRHSTDIHTHFSGALRPESLIRLGVEENIYYPVKMIFEMERYSGEKILPPNWALEKINGEDFLPLKTAPPEVLRKLGRHLSLDVSKVENFDSLEKIYDWRDPFVKDVKYLKKNLIELAKDYAKNGVKYVELSNSDILKNPKFLAALHEIIPLIEREYFVHIRFLATIPRLGHPDLIADYIKKTKFIAETMQDPYVVGVDFMGHERNPTSEFVEKIKELAKIKTARPDFQIRVHAGESALHPSNVKDAIKAGATRIGHGVNGIDDETIALAKKSGTIIEFNLNSNLALNNIKGVQEIPFKKYVDAGIPIFLGTDGHGMYHTSTLSEAETFYDILRNNKLSLQEISDLGDKMELANKYYAGNMLSLSRYRERALPKDYLEKLHKEFPESSVDKNKITLAKIEAEKKAEDILSSKGKILSNANMIEFFFKAKPLYIGGYLLQDPQAQAFYQELLAGLSGSAEKRTVLLPLGSGPLSQTAIERLRGFARISNIKVLPVLSDPSVVEQIPPELRSQLVFTGTDPWKRAGALSHHIREFEGEAIFWGGSVLESDEIQMLFNNSRRVFVVKNSGGAASRAAKNMDIPLLDERSVLHIWNRDPNSKTQQPCSYLMSILGRIGFRP